MMPKILLFKLFPSFLLLFHFFGNLANFRVQSDWSQGRIMFSLLNENNENAWTDWFYFWQKLISTKTNCWFLSVERYRFSEWLKNRKFDAYGDFNVFWRSSIYSSDGKIRYRKYWSILKLCSQKNSHKLAFNAYA